MAIGRAVANVYAAPGGFTPGRIPYDKMVRLDDVPGNWFANDSMYAQPETAAAVRWIYAECQRQGLKSVRPNECYRSWDTSAFWKRYWTALGKPGNAADPGQSPHNTGYAVDWDCDPAERATFVNICIQAGMRFNIPGEWWHSAPIANATVDLTSLGAYLAALAAALVLKTTKEHDMAIIHHKDTDSYWELSPIAGFVQIDPAQAINLAKSLDGFITELEGDQIESYKTAGKRYTDALQFNLATMNVDLSAGQDGSKQVPLWRVLRKVLGLPIGD